MATKKFEIKRKFGSNKHTKLWFNHCAENNIPYVIISAGNLYADVVWENITLQESNYIRLIENKLKVRYNILLLCEKYRHRKLKFKFSNLFGCFDNVCIEDAKSIATIVYDTITSCSGQEDSLSLEKIDNL